MIGKVGDIEAEALALLNKHNIKDEEFSEETIDYLKSFPVDPVTNDLLITEEERSKREDLT